MAETRLKKVDYRAALKRRREFFHRPCTVREIIGPRQTIETEKDGLVDAVEECAKDMDGKAVLVHGNILPFAPTSADWETNIEPWRLFLRYGEEVNLRVPRSIREALQREISPIKLKIDRFQQMNAEADYCGITWTGIRSRIKRRVHLVDAIEGMKLFAFSELAREDIDRIVVQSYIDTKKVNDQGGVYVVTVPSRSRSFNYLIRLESVPIPGAEKERAIWPDLRAEHVCEENAYDFGYRTKIQSYGFCPHINAGILAVAKQEKHRGFMLMPNPLMRRAFVERFYNILKSRVMILEERVRENGKTLREKRPLNKGEIEWALWKKIQKYETGHRYKNTCYAKAKEGKIQEYSWILK